jgi:DNA-binding winged helix-turn-helix (wHTH) protein/tetratricopeptide (TPR) repeat protein
MSLLTIELEQGFYIGPWRIEPKINRISMLNNDEVIEHLVTPKVMALCLLLAENQGNPVSQETIVERIWPNLAISDSSIYQAVAQLRKALQDTQPQKHYVERVSGKGYRLIKPISLLEATQTNSNSITKKPELLKSKQPFIRIVIAAITLVIIAGIGFLSSQNKPPKSESEFTEQQKLTNLGSMAIRPTQNLTQPRQEQLDTFGHLLLSDLLSIPDINLILMRDGHQISNADVELTHSLSNEGGALLLSAQLTQRESQQVIWAAEFNAQDNALLGLKQQLTSALKSALKSDSLTPKPFSEPLITLNKTLYETFVLAQYLWNKREPADLEAALSLYKKILQQQPDNIETLVGLCNTYLFLHIYSDWTEPKAYSACIPLIDKANRLSPKNGKVLATKALLSGDDNPETIIELFETSIAQSPNYANAYLWYGNFLRTQGEVEEALVMHQKALSLDPLSPNINRSLAYSLLNLRKLQQAKQYYQRSLTIEPIYSLRPVEELDFLPLNIERAKQFILWSQGNASNLSQRTPYLLTQALVRLGLGQTTAASSLIEKSDPNQANPAFWLYTQAALNVAQGDMAKAAMYLKERYLQSINQLENTNRHVIPYLALLMHTQQYHKAHELFVQHFPDINNQGEISDRNSGQFVFLNALLISKEQSTESTALTEKLTAYFNGIKEPPLTLAYVQWLAQSNQNLAAVSAIENMLAQGWLPDFNDNILAEINIRKAYTNAGGDQRKFNRLLAQNQTRALN